MCEIHGAKVKSKQQTEQTVNKDKVTPSKIKMQKNNKIKVYVLVVVIVARIFL